MEFNFLNVMAYLVVIITLVTMIFGIVAYTIYKMREAKRAKIKHSADEIVDQSEAQKEKFLFFEQKEIIL